MEIAIREEKREYGRGANSTGKLTARQSVLENLFEAKELEDGQIHGRVKSQSAFVRSQGRVELHAVATVHLDLALVVFPGDAELDDALGDGADFQGAAVFGVLLEERRVLERRGKLCVIAIRSIGPFSLV